jgi:hypothetical protein
MKESTDIIRPPQIDTGKGPYIIRFTHNLTLLIHGNQGIGLRQNLRNISTGTDGR